ncbi:MAG: hypothetical protein FWF73_01930 [Spirochaetes bacterium]|nr:hypothetical protein [Spirochaetota bacterium]
MATIIYSIAAISISMWVRKIFQSDIFGVICFIFFLPGYKLPLLIDMAFFVYFDHHKRNDARAEKVILSERVITKEQTKELLQAKADRKKAHEEWCRQYDENRRLREKYEIELEKEGFKVD